MRMSCWRQAAVSSLALVAFAAAGCGEEPAPTPAAPPADEAAAPIPTPAPTQAPARRQPPQVEPGAQMPADFPSELPAPPSAQQVAAYDGGVQHTVVVYESTADPSTVFGALKAGYPSSGWAISFAEQNGGDGLITATKGSGTVVALISRTESGKTKIEVTSIGGM